MKRFRTNSGGRLALKNFFFLFSIALFFISQKGRACDEFLNQVSSKKVQEKMEQLHLENADDATLSQEETLIFLKNEIWKLLPDGSIPWKEKGQLSEALQEHLKKHFQKAFRTEEMSAESLYLFYVNQVRSVYFLALREWMEGVVQEMAAEKELSRFQKSVGLSLMSRSLSAASLFRDTLSPKLTQEVLDQKSWREFPWKNAFEIMAQFPQDQQLPLKELQEWLYRNELTEALSPSQRSSLEMALREPTFANPCCLTDPGCVLCPNNRGWLRKHQ